MPKGNKLKSSDLVRQDLKSLKGGNLRPALKLIDKINKKNKSPTVNIPVKGMK